MGVVVNLPQRRSAKASDAACPAMVRQASRTTDARRLCVSAAIYGFALAGAIQAQAAWFAIVLLAFGYVALRRLR